MYDAISGVVPINRATHMPLAWLGIWDLVLMECRVVHTDFGARFVPLRIDVLAKAPESQAKRGNKPGRELEKHKPLAVRLEWGIQRTYS